MGLELKGQGDKPSKTPPNISDIVSKFAKVCSFRSIGVFASDNGNDNPRQHLYSSSGYFGKSCGEETSSSDVTDEADMDDDKVHPQPVEVENKGIECGRLDVLELFDNVRALTLAYVQVQEAHVPYDPDKFRIADGLVISHLKDLCKVQSAYEEKQLKYTNSLSACSALLLSEIQVQEALLEKLKCQVKMKKDKAVKLCRELQTLELLNEKLREELRVQVRANVKVVKLPSFEEVAKLVGKAIHDFGKPLIALMKVSGWDLDQAAKVIEDSVVYYKISHKKYAFEAYIARRMFYGFTAHSDNMHPVIKFDDPINALIEDPQSSFATFCKTKYLLVVHPKMEESFFGNEDHRNLVRNGVHPHTPFYRAFVKMAKWVWILQGIASVVEPKVDIFRVKRGSRFSTDYMECVEEVQDDMKAQERSLVEFMVTPGFKIGEVVLKSRVYLSKLKS
ncbi:hypothetical protein Leryth_025727 [Lithospermum erythrorhizon]|nr:hypothetical protein Leryth_025727 [Lithospermum erythrorhizon]